MLFARYMRTLGMALALSMQGAAAAFGVPSQPRDVEIDGAVVQVRGLLTHRDGEFAGGVLRYAIRVGDIDHFETTSVPALGADGRASHSFTRAVNLECSDEPVQVTAEMAEWSGEGDRSVELAAEIVLVLKGGALVQYRGVKRFARDEQPSVLELLPISGQAAEEGPGAYALPAPRASIPGIVTDEAAAQIAFESRLWKRNILLVAFRGGDEATRAEIEKIAQEWTPTGTTSLHLMFRRLDRQTEFNVWPSAEQPYRPDVRIDLTDRTAPNAAYLGESARLAHADEPTMWLGAALADYEAGRVGTFRAAVLHEFGHALGFSHTHQDDRAHVDLNWDALYARYGRDSDIHAYFRPIGLIFPFEPSPNSVIRAPLGEDVLLQGKNSPWYLEEPLSSLTDFDKALVRHAYPLQLHEAFAELKSAMYSAAFTPAAIELSPDPPKTATHAFLRETWEPLKDFAFQGRGRLGSGEEWRQWVCGIRAKEVITLLDKTFQPGDLVGVGIFVDLDVVLTASHVVPTEEIAKRCVICFDYHLGKGDIAIAEILCSSQATELDYVVLRTAKNGRSAYSLQSASESGSISQRQPVTLHFLDRVLVGTSFVHECDRRHGHATCAAQNFIGHSVNTSPGMSGGLVLDGSESDLLAIHQGLAKDQEFYDLHNGGQPVGIAVSIHSVIRDIREKWPNVASKLSLPND